MANPFGIGISTYQFPTPKTVTRLYVMSYSIYGGTLTLQGSNNGITYTNLGNNPYILNNSIDDTFINTTAYTYYKITLTSSATGGEGIRTIQLYGY